ncbi:MAG: hypothetical protein WB799_01315 [Candidatus Sulfotelmatobacter sp.]
MYSRTLIAVSAYDHVTTPFSVDEGKQLGQVASYLKLKSGNCLLREKVGLNKDPTASVELSKCRSSTASSQEQLTARTRF